MVEKNSLYEIVLLPREKWRGTVILMRYTATEYYDVVIRQTANCYQNRDLERKEVWLYNLM